MGKCKIDGSCDKGMDVCCFECGLREGCQIACEAEPTDCGEYEPTNELDFNHNAGVLQNIEDVTDVLIQMKKLEDQSKVLKKKLLDAMEKFGVKSFENERIKMTYVAPTKRTSLDTKLLQKQDKKLYDQLMANYGKESDVSSSVRITVK